MHKDFEINLHNISKIEGHTHLDVVVKKGKAVSAKLKISENKRFYSNAVIGMPYQQAPSRVSRICGTCSPAHLSCACEALENALDFNITEQTRILRELLLIGNLIRDHAMHLYFFCLPDIIGKDSVLDFETEEEKELIHKALHVKEAGNNLCTVVGGRAVHPTFENVGSFLKIPDSNDVKKIVEELKNCRGYAVEFCGLFFKKDLVFERETNFVALCGKNYSLAEGVIKTSSGRIIKDNDFLEHVERVVLPYSTAAAFEFDFCDYMVGALARVNLNKNELHKNTKKDCAKYLEFFPSNNLFYNNLAQAIEIVHCIDKAIELLSHDFKNEKTPEIKIKKANRGVGTIEAPRGTLFYTMDIDNLGVVRNSEIIIPTSQNIINMEDAIVDFVNQELDNKSSKEEITRKVERLIRAYDPCMSCATHFLKICWK